MKGLEDRLRLMLDEQARGISGRAELDGRFLRTVRLRQFAVIASGVLLSASLVTGIAAGVTTIFSDSKIARTPAAPPSTSRVYVLDEKQGSDSEILVINPRDGATLDSYSAFDDPAMALSPDGSRLYVASLHPSPDYGHLEDVLSIVDTESGRLVEEVQLDGSRWRFPGAVFFSTLTPSPLGENLYILQNSPDGTSQESIGTFDTITGELLPGKAEIPGCGTASVLPTDEQGAVAVVCPDSNDVRFLRISTDGSTSEVEATPLPDGGQAGTDANGNSLYLNRISWASLSPDLSTLYAATGGGQVSVVDVRSRQVVETVSIELPSDSAVGLNKVAVSEDGSHLYLGVGDRSVLGVVLATDVLVVDVQDWNVTSRVSMPGAFWSFTPAGNRLFAISNEGRRLDAIDTTTNRRAEVLENVGTEPRFGVAP